MPINGIVFGTVIDIGREDYFMFASRVSGE